MKRFQEFITRMSLTQQLMILMIGLVTFFSIFFFVYVHGSVNNAINQQTYKSLDNTQSALLSVNSNVSGYININGVETFSVAFMNGNMPHIRFPYGYDYIEKEWKQILDDLDKVEERNLKKYHGLIKDVDAELDSYYSILKVDEDIYWISKIYSNSMSELKNVLVNSLVYISVFVVLFIFMIILAWVLTLIHPLNLIRNYIDKIRHGEEATLEINRKDEIGELAVALVDMKAALDRQEKTKEEMVHNISHDLKTPIATIKSYGESIKDGIYPYETLEKSVDVIIENANRLETKVHSLLYMNRIEYLISQSGENSFTEMKKIVETVVQHIKFIKPEIEIITNLEDVKFEGIEETWRVAVENILDNALRYARTKIEINLSEENGLTIANDGEAIDESRLQTLFKPFEKGQGGKFGLGLSIVAKVVHANHYHVVAENTYEGVIFRIFKKIDYRRK